MVILFNCMLVDEFLVSARAQGDHTAFGCVARRPVGRNENKKGDGYKKRA